MSTVATAARHELLASVRAKAPYALVAAFLGMVAASTFIGWRTTVTVTAIYQQVLADGLTTQPNPFTDVSPLYYVRNTVIYVLLIGSLMAATLGVQSALRDRRAETAALIGTRPVDQRAVRAGRLAGLGILLAGLVAITELITWISVSAVVGTPLTGSETLAVAGFGVLTWLLLVGFAGIGVLSGRLLRRERTALLAPVVVWAVIAFVVPQLGTAARPVSLLNPVPLPAQASGAFAWLSQALSPLAITEHFKTSSAALLGSPYTGSALVSALVVAGFACIALAAAILIRADRTTGGTHE
ncbi:ABC transporter permease [Demequina capsici]|uniref:ABC transporter permease n=1 Tax=Demequina capsici TaxID=3075620 RepID=A0AA96F706_9MICO|nr:ABC transporter permease [Demequina sp. OYTSA14]WNM23905.1 ABC transporter permease [Demequina sp. OYTSA14]